MQSGGLCLAGPGGTSLPRVSPRIRALQDRLMDSLPADGAWDCLSPAQRNAILSLHAARLAAAEDESSEHGYSGTKTNKKSLIGLTRYGRSRSYDDRLESETDDSGVRGLGSGGTGSTSHSQNSHEDDSSDPGVKRNGRFTKAVSADRNTKKDTKTIDFTLKSSKNKAEVTNGFGNVNKIISKQMNKNVNGSNPPPSNITLDCRNVIGEKRRRSRIDIGNVFKDNNTGKNNKLNNVNTGKNGDKLPTTGGVLSRKNILQKYDDKLLTVNETKESASSEEYDSGVNFKGDDSVDEYIKDKQNLSSEFDADIDSLKTPRSDSTTNGALKFRDFNSIDRLHIKKDVLNTKKNGSKLNFENQVTWENQIVNRREKNKSKERDVSYPDKTKSKISEPLKSNLKMNYGAKLNSSFDYRTDLNKDSQSKYNGNWNNIILNNDIFSKQVHISNQRDSRFSKNATNNGLNKSTGNLVSNKQVSYPKKTEITWMTNESKRPNEKNANKKYYRSKSLDRKYLDESTDDESDFETRRRNERVKRHHKNFSEWDQDRGKDFDHVRSRSRDFLEGPKAHFNESAAMKPKAKSAWDLTDQSNKSIDDFDLVFESGFKSRSDMRNKWKMEEKKSKVNKDEPPNDGFEDFQQAKWKRRSCDFELDCNNDEFTLSKPDKTKEFDRRRWYRRSCDLDVDFDLHYPNKQNQQRKKMNEIQGKKFDMNEDEYLNDIILSDRNSKYPEGNWKKGHSSMPVPDKRSKSRLIDNEAQRMKMEEETIRNMDFEFDRRLRFMNEGGRKSQLNDDFNRMNINHDINRRWMENDMMNRRYFASCEFDANRRNRFEDFNRARTSMGHYEKEKRERSRTPHALRGKLRLIKQILFF